MMCVGPIADWVAAVCVKIYFQVKLLAGFISSTIRFGVFSDDMSVRCLFLCANRCWHVSFFTSACEVAAAISLRQVVLLSLLV